jgi:tRNA-specific 2-thiouridylase
VDGRVIVAMSGGVDSSVAALRLLRDGHEVHGLFMSNWEEDEEGYCSSAEDYQDARRVCGELGIPLHRVSFAREYRDQVFAHFLAEYAAGRTPNPDVLCNREIKFGACLEYARRLGASRFATGHYARIDHAPGGPRLLRAVDRDKDQTYFLHAVGREQLATTLFPIGDLPKSEVRELARTHGLPVFAKRDSTGICFIGERPFRRFLETYLPAQPGPIETELGERIGEHAGLMYYTLGQRAGLGLGGRRGAREAPWYVAAKDLARNALVVVQDSAHPLLMSSALTAGPVHWIAGRPPAGRFDCGVQVRYRQPPQPCSVVVEDGGIATVSFAGPQRAVTPGQYAVLYDGEACLGGGVIHAGAATAAARPHARAGTA